MTTVYAAHIDTVIWSDNKKVHKAGKVPLGEPLRIIRVYINWRKIERPANISLPVNDAYPDYWVHANDVVYTDPMPVPEDPPVDPPPEPGDIPEEEVAAAILLLLRWLKQ